MSEISLSLANQAAVAGSTITVNATVEADRYKRIVLSLVLIERNRKRLETLSFGAFPARLIWSKEVPAGYTEIEVPIPADLPPAYTGSMIGWDYEIRLEGKRTGKDGSVSKPIEIVLPRSADESGRDDSKSAKLAKRASFGNRCHSPQLRRSQYIREPGLDLGMSLFLGVVCPLVAAGFGISFFTLADELGMYIMLGLMTIVFSGFALSVLPDLFGPPRKMSSVSFSVENRPGPGEPLQVRVDKGSAGSLEVVLSAVEFVEISSSSSSSTAGGARTKTLKEVVYSRTVPVTGTVVEIPTDQCKLEGYPGQKIALHWCVTVQSTKTPTGRGTVAVDIRPAAD